MSRPESKKVFYFPHFVKKTVEQDLIEYKHGAEGYRAYYRLLELVADADYHRLSVASEDEKIMFDLGMNGDSEVIEDVIRILVDRGLINKLKWENDRIIWMQDFVETLKPVYVNRRKPLPSIDKVSTCKNTEKRKEKKRKKKKSREKEEELLSFDDYQERFPDIEINKSLNKYIKYANKPNHDDAINWLENEKVKKKPEFRRLKSGLYEAFCSKCNKKEMPNKKQLHFGSSCCRVEYVPVKDQCGEKE